MSAGDPPPLDQDLRGLLRRAATIEPAPAEARGRIRARLQGLVGPWGGGDGGGGEAGGGGHQDGSAGGAPNAAGLGARPALPSGALSMGASTSARLARRMLPLVVSFALGGGAGVLVARPRAGHPVAEAPAQVVYVERPVERPLEPAPGTRAPEPSLLPGAEAPPAFRSSRAPASALTAERLLLDVARQALEREDPTAALAATTRHGRRYPAGILAQEREVMAIRALAALHRGAEARQRAARFRVHYPDSLFLPAIEAAIAGSETER